MAAFLNVPIKNIGQIGGGRRNVSGTIDVAVIQNLNRKQVVDDLFAQWESDPLELFSFPDLGA